ncbi:short-chain fatty acid transporter [Eudoraea chungangensis]|uniref:short-chain fatty acid transporter n=1 Tax=Eudoraea chungangensis TaxID=1481905 RepID=UPI0023EB942F|nr:TIGR00366 family protein [Eudoraea chungangensis]
MILKLGAVFSDLFVRYMPSAYVFALILTLITALSAFFWADASFFTILNAWYDGFWTLLAFGMQIVLIIVTASCLAQSNIFRYLIEKLVIHIKTPIQVYLSVFIFGSLVCLLSFGMAVVCAIFARELASRVKGINYPFLIACVYASLGTWVTGASSSIALLLNTPDNFLIKTGVLTQIIPTGKTLGSTLNISMLLVILLVTPIVFLVLRPKSSKSKELNDLLIEESAQKIISIKEEAESYKLPFKATSDLFNNTNWIQDLIALFGLIYIVSYFYKGGFNLNFNIIIFAFLMLGLLLHRTPMRYTVAMKRASQNISGILFQYPFYAGIMGIILYSGLGNKIGEVQSAMATLNNYPFMAYISGGIVNFAIPSAGGEFAVIGPNIIQVVQSLGTDLPTEEVQAMIAKASMAIAYGESLSNMLQPFYLLLILPVMAKGIRIQARDIMGYLVIPFIVFFIIQSALILWIPL